VWTKGIDAEATTPRNMRMYPDRRPASSTVAHSKTSMMSRVMMVPLRSNPFLEMKRKQHE
jgi:hypothetical protein